MSPEILIQIALLPFYAGILLLGHMARPVYFPSVPESMPSALEAQRQAKSAADALHPGPEAEPGL